MIYFKFKDKFSTQDQTDNSKLSNIIIKLLRLILPKANPDFENKYHEVSLWYIEFDENNNHPNREVGLDSDGKAIVKAPYKENFGFWTDTDLTLEDYEKFDIEIISVDEFEKLWEQI